MTQPGNGRAVIATPGSRSNRVLTNTGLTMNAVRAKTFAELIDCFECIDRMTMMAEGRRDTMLREIEWHRESFSKRLRHAIVVAEDTEFKVLATAEATASGQTGTQAPESG